MAEPFPEVRWGREDSAAAVAGRWFAGTRAGSWLGRTLVPLDRKVLALSQGRFTAFGPLGSPLLLLTTTGASSGLSRTTPLLYLLDDDGDRLLVVGSNFGQASHPAWSDNLMADPQAMVEIGGTACEVCARLLDGMDRAQAWRRFTDEARQYLDYQARTDRAFRIFSLERR